MRDKDTTLIRPELVTTDDYIKQRERCRNDYENFVAQRNAERTIECFQITIGIRKKVTVNKPQNDENFWLRQHSR